MLLSRCLNVKVVFIWRKKIATKLASDTADAVIAMLAPFNALVHTITADNGLEFTDHESIVKELDADVILPIRMPRGSAAQLRMPTDYFDSMFQKELT